MGLPPWIDNRRAELRFALRMIRKAPGVAVIAVLSLALGIGANTAIFSVLDAVLLRSLPVKAPHQLYMPAALPRSQTIWNYPDYCAFRDHNRLFTGLAGYSGGAQPLGMQVDRGSTELVQAVLVSGNYFQVLGVEPALGRLLNPEDDRAPGAGPHAVLSHEFWQRRFAADPRIIGQKIRLNGFPFTIVGVAPRGFRGADVTFAPHLFLPILMRGEITGVPFARWNNRNHWWMHAIGRLKPDANIRQAEAELYGIYQQQEAAQRKTAADQRFVNRAQPIQLLPAARGYSFARNRLEKPLLILMVVVGLVLLIACANVANLMLARGAARQREMAVRLAVGASRSRLGSQLLAESLVLALAGGAAGLMLAQFGTDALLRFLPQPGYMQLSLDVSPDLRLLAFSFAVTLLTGLLFGLAPALQSTRPSLVPALKDGAPGAAGASRGRLRKVLVGAQVALSLLLAVGAGLFVRSLGNLRDLDPGFRRDRTITISVDPSRNGYQGQRLREFYERLRAEVERMPGVQSVSLAGYTPLSGSRSNRDISVEGYTPKPGERCVVDFNGVGPRYFETFGIPILLGRDFRDQDNPPYSLDPPVRFEPGVRPPEPPGPRVAIVTESFAKRFLAGRNPVGARLGLEEKYDPARAYEIVGVVKDASYFELRNAPEPMVYIPAWRGQAGFRALAIRTTRDMPEILEAVRRQVTAIDPGVPVLAARTIDQLIDNHILESRLMATLSGFFGAVALLLAAVGLYGVVSYGVTQRTREIGIRMALGAPRAAVLRLVARDAAVPVLLGAAAGLAAALALTRLVRALLYGVSPYDPAALIAAALVLGGAAALAAWIPARRATKVDPTVALRFE